MLKKVKVSEAMGLTLAHDVTKILPGQFKGAAFRRGHIIEENDIPQLLNLGKEHVYVLELLGGEVHEEEAAIRIAKAVAGSGLKWAEPKEGKVDIKAKASGLLKVNVSLLEKINSTGEVIVATLHNNTICHPQMMVAGTKIIPLFTTEVIVASVEHLCLREGKVIEVIPFKEKRFGVVIVGNEVFTGRVQDGFTEVIQKKLEAFNLTINYKAIVPDDVDSISQAITELKLKGSEVILACGGMSVDPDDVTPTGIEKVGAKIVFYGIPIIPGSMFLYAIWEDIPILGVPGGVMYDPITLLDLLLPRVLAEEDISHQDIIKLGHGGLCLHCPECSFPVCPFGK